MTNGQHPDTDKVFGELGQIPAWRAQCYSPDVDQGNPRKRISECLHEADTLLQTKGEAFFQKHPDLEEAPYGFFLRFNPETLLHDVTVQVGNESMIAERGSALACIVHGKIERNLIR